MKFTVTIEGVGRDAREKRVLESRAGESAGHIALKILACVLHGPDIRVEEAVGQRHKPDLVRTDPDGAVALWVDCGQIETKRLGRIAAANRAARIVVLKRTAREADLYARAASRDLPAHAAGRVRVVGFDDGFVARFEAALSSGNAIRVEQVAPELRLTLGDDAFASALSAFDPTEARR